MQKFLYIFSLLLIYSCGGDTKSSGTGEPSNLNVEVLISEVDLGLVTIQASAENTSEFHFYPNDGVTFDPIINNTGTFMYTYQSLGTYVIEVRAYSGEGRFIKKTKQIVVNGNDPINVGQGYSTPTSYEGMDLIWNEEFSGSSLNENNWSYEIGDGCPHLCGWGNEELEYYRKENTSVGDGVLTIEARKQNFQGRNYTSSRLISRDKQYFKYGRYDIRAKLPKGQGIWPAIWLLGQNQTTVGWPKCGEIDIMEMVGGSGKENSSHGNAFWDNNGKQDNPGDYVLPSGIFSDEFHVFTLIWDESNLKYYVDDNLFHTISITDVNKSEFHEPFFFILNVAVGGIWPGSPDATTVFPTAMNVDYIRVFQKK
jgi:beta-glucanase (GH16 family)